MLLIPTREGKGETNPLRSQFFSSFSFDKILYIDIAKSNESNTCKEDTKRIITVDNKSHIKQKS